MTIRAGVVGVGYLGRHHARIYAELEGVQLTAVMDVNTASASEEVCKYDGCKVFDNLDEFLSEVDVVSIVTPTVLHHDVAMKCLEAGKHLLIEKPITATVAEADEIIAKARERKLIIQVGHLERYNPAVVKMMEFVKNPVFIESERLSPFQGRGTDVDVTLDLMIHDIDIVMSLLGEKDVSDFRVVGTNVLTENVDVAKAWLDFPDGITALITASRISGGKKRTLKLYQRDSFVMLDYIDMSIRKYTKGDGGKEILSEVIKVEPKEPLKEELADFIDAVANNRTPGVTAEDGRNALAVAMRITDKINDQVNK